MKDKGLIFIKYKVLVQMNVDNTDLPLPIAAFFISTRSNQSRRQSHMTSSAPTSV